MPKSSSMFSSRPLPAWIDDLQQAESGDLRYRALLAINSMASADQAIRWCQHAIADADSGVRALAAKQLGGWKRRDTPLDETAWRAIGAALQAHLNDDDPDVRFETARSLGRITPELPEAAGVLLSLLDDEGTQPLMIAAVVSALGERVNLNSMDMIPRLRRLASHSQAEVRESVSEVAAKLGKAAEGLLAELLVAIDDEEPIVRENAAISLGNCPASPQVLEALLIAGNDDDEGVAAAALASRTRLIGQPGS